MKCIRYPLSTEKSIRLMESRNILTFIISPQSTKGDVKKDIEETFKVKVIDVRTLSTPKGEKKAYVKISRENPAIDIATQMGLM